MNNEEFDNIVDSKPYFFKDEFDFLFGLNYILLKS